MKRKAATIPKITTAAITMKAPEDPPSSS